MGNAEVKDQAQAPGLIPKLAPNLHSAPATRDAQALRNAKHFWDLALHTQELMLKQQLPPPLAQQALRLGHGHDGCLRCGLRRPTLPHGQSRSSTELTERSRPLGTRWWQQGRRRW